ncbi:hypothetical protein AVEN_56760-1 [Araneus ventricosus]|uniref:Uncharacterized protein n=1 Tax=Araneus ventricosus TaxID=182803 RepID=A0A4Y2EYP3_ARAVE|nr:hypothetical protein AVEN_56760-1 [Araneus ventricosus]
MLKSYVVAKRPPVSVAQKYPHWPGLLKKGVRPVEDQRGESRPTSMWRTGFIGRNEMIQALPEQGQLGRSRIDSSPRLVMSLQNGVSPRNKDQLPQSNELFDWRKGIEATSSW